MAPKSSSASTTTVTVISTVNAAASSRSSSSTSNPPSGDAKTDKEKEKPRLTDQEKRYNHIASEQKRRAAIREGFDRLTELVPGLEGQARSESIVLRKTVEFVRTGIDERHRLIKEVEALGGVVPERLKAAVAKEEP